MASDGKPFRFYDNRQKYLSFVTTCNEKWKIAERAIDELQHITPSPPALRIFDAGMGDGTLLSHVMRATHKRFPTVPLYVVGKEISLEDIRLSLEKLPDRFVEHPSSVVIFTNLYYAESPWLTVSKPELADGVNWMDVPLHGDTAAEFGEQLRDLDPQLVDGWQVRASEKTGNPLYVKPSVLVLYREDHSFALDSVKPKPAEPRADFDLVLVSQPWRARMTAAFKVDRVLEPMIRGLAPGGRALVAQSSGNDPGLELIRGIWPDADPFKVSRHELIETLRDRLGDKLKNYKFHAVSDAESILSYEMHTLPDEIQTNIGTSTLFAAWNAAVYVAQIEDERLEAALASGAYLEQTAKTLKKFGGLWFNDEVFVVSRNA
jgi:SAM-dependent methyltransferase